MGALNRICGRSTSAWCHPGGESGLRTRLCSRLGHALDDHDDDADYDDGALNSTHSLTDSAFTGDF